MAYKSVEELYSSINKQQQPASQQVSPVSGVDQQLMQSIASMRPDMGKVENEISQYTVASFKDSNVLLSLAGYAETYHGNVTAKLSLEAAKTNPGMIGMTSSEAESSPVKSTGRVMAMNVADAATQMYIEEYNKTKNIVAASAKAKQFIDYNTKALASFKDDRGLFDQAIANLNSEDIKQGKAGVYDPIEGKFYETNMMKGVSSGLSDSFMKNLAMSTAATFFSTEGNVEGAAGLVGGMDWAALYRDQLKNVNVVDQLKKEDTYTATMAGDILGSVAGIAAIIGENAITVGAAGAARGAQLGWKGKAALGAALQFTRGTAQDTLDNSALAVKYGLGNEYQKSNYKAMLASRTFDLLTGMVGGIASEKVIGKWSGNALQKIAALDGDKAKALIDFGVKRGIKASAIDMATESAVDFMSHALITKAATNAGIDKPFTESQMLSLDIGAFADNPSMVARYLFMKTASRGIGGAFSKATEKRMADITGTGDTKWYEDPGRESGLNWGANLVRKVGDFLNNDIYTDIDRRLRDATGKSGSTPIGLRNILTNPEMNKQFQTEYGKDWLTQQYVVNQLSTNILYHAYNKGAYVPERETGLSIFSSFVNRQMASETMDISKDKDGNVLSEQQQTGVLRDVVKSFLGKSTESSVSNDMNKLLAFLVDKNINASMSEKVGINLRVGLDEAVEEQLRTVFSGNNELVQSTRKQWSDSLKQSASEKRSLKEVYGLRNDQQYIQQEFETREAIAKNYNLVNNSKQVLDSVLGSKEDLLKQWNDTLVRDQSEQGTIRNMFARVEDTYNVDTRNTINDTISELSKTLRDAGTVTEGQSYAQIDKSMTSAAKSLLAREKSRLESIVVNVKDPETKAQQYLLSMQRIKNLNSIFGHKLVGDIHDVFYGGNEKNGLGSEVLDDINNTFIKAVKFDKDILNRLTTPYDTGKTIMEQRDGKVEKNVWAAYHAKLVETTQNQFFGAKTLEKLFSSGDGIKHISRLYAQRLANPGQVQGDQDPSVTNMIINGAVISRHESLFAGDTNGILTDYFRMVYETAVPNVKFNEDELAIIVNTIANKALSKYLRYNGDSSNVADAVEFIYSSMVKNDKHAVITKDSLRTSNIQDIIDEYINPKGKDLKDKVYDLVDSAAVSSLADNDKDYRVNLAKAINLYTPRGEVEMPIWDIPLDLVDKSALHIWTENGNRKTGDYKELLGSVERAMDDEGYSAFQSVGMIINSAKDSQSAVEGIKQYLRDISVVSGIKLDGMTPIGTSVKPGTSQLDVIANTIVKMELHKRFTSSNVSPFASYGNTRQTYTVSAIANATNTTYLGNGVRIFSFEDGEIDLLADKSDGELNDINIVHMGNKGTSSSGVYISTAMPLKDGQAADFIDSSEILRDIHSIGKTKTSWGTNFMSDTAIKAFDNIGNATTDNEVVRATVDAFNTYKAELKQELVLAREKYAEFKGIEPDGVNLKDLTKISSDVFQNMINQLSLVKSITGSTIDPDSIIKGLYDVGKIDTNEKLQQIRRIASSYDYTTMDTQQLSRMLAELRSVAGSFKTDAVRKMSEIKQMADKEMAYSVASIVRGAYEDFVDKSIDMGGAIYSAAYDKLSKQIDAIDGSDKRIDIRSPREAFANLCKLAYAGESLFTASDLQKRMSVSGLGQAAPTARDLTKWYDDTIGTKPVKVYVFASDNDIGSGTLGLPESYINYWRKVTEGDGTKCAVSDGGDLTKIMSIETSQLKTQLAGKYLVDQDGTAIRAEDIDDDSIMLNIETAKNLGVAFASHLPKVAPEVLPTGELGVERTLDNKGRVSKLESNSMVFHDGVLGRSLLLNRISIHSDLRPVAGKGNLGSQVGLLDKQIGKVISSYDSDTVDAALSKAKGLEMNAIMDEDPVKAFKEFQSIIAKGSKYQKYSAPLRQFIKYDTTNSVVLADKLQHAPLRSGGQSFTQPSVGIGTGWLMNQLKATEGFSGNDKAIALFNKFAADPKLTKMSPAEADALVRDTMEHLTKQDVSILTKVDGRYYLMGVRYPAENFGQAGLFNITHVRKGISHNGIEADPSYMPYIQKADYDGDYIQGFPIRLNDFALAFNLDPKDKNYQKNIVAAMADRIAYAYNNMSQVEDATITAHPDILNIVLKSSYMGNNLGAFVKEVELRENYSNSTSKKIYSHIESDLAGYFSHKSEEQTGQRHIPYYNFSNKFDQRRSWQFFYKDKTSAGFMHNPVGSVAAWKVRNSQFKVGNHAYKIMSGYIGEQPVKYTDADGKSVETQGRTQIAHFIISSDSDGKFATHDFGNRVVGVLKGRVEDRDIMETLQSFNAVDLETAGRNLHDQIKGQKLGVGETIETLMKQLSVTAGYAGYRDLSSRELRVANGDFMFKGANGTGTDSAKYHGLAATAYQYKEQNFVETVSDLMEGLSAAKHVYIGDFGDKSASVANFKLDNLATVPAGLLDAGTVTSMAKQMIREKAPMSFQQYKMLSTIGNGKFNEVEDMAKAAWTASILPLGSDYRQISQDYSPQFALAYRFFEARNAEKLGILRGTGMNVRQFSEGYIGGRDAVNDFVMKQYYDSGIKTIKTTKANGEEVEVAPLFVHQWWKDLYTKALGTDNIVEGLDDATTLKMKLELSNAATYIETIDGRDLMSDNLNEYVIDKILKQTELNNPELHIGRETINNALTSLGVIGKGVTFKVEKITSADVMKGIVDKSSGEYENYTKAMQINPYLRKQLYDSFNKDYKLVISMVNKDGKNLTAGALVSLMNNQLSGIKNSNYDDNRTHSAIYSALVGMSNGPTAQIAYLRKIGISEEVEKVFNKNYEALRNNKRLASSYDMDMELVAPYLNQSYKRFAVSTDYMAPNLKSTIINTVNCR